MPHCRHFGRTNDLDLDVASTSIFRHTRIRTHELPFHNVAAPRPSPHTVLSSPPEPWPRGARALRRPHLCRPPTSFSAAPTSLRDALSPIFHPPRLRLHFRCPCDAVRLLTIPSAPPRYPSTPPPPPPVSPPRCRHCRLAPLSAATAPPPRSLHASAPSPRLLYDPPVPPRSLYTSSSCRRTCPIPVS